MLTQPSLTLARRLNAPAARVFEAWTDPQKIVQWFGPGQTVGDSVKADMDVRVGGHFRISFKTDDGEYHEVSGKYLEVSPPQRLVFSWAWHSTPERESLVTISMKPEGSGTLLTFHHAQFADATARDNHERGWMELLGKLESYLESYPA